MNVRQFTVLNDNPFWNLLQEANQAHVTAQARHLGLLKMLEEKGVNFNEIQNFLLNEAKRAGLHQKCVWNSEGTAKTYKTKSGLKKDNSAWFIALQNFMRWVRYNYDGSYTRRITTAMRQERAEKRKAEKGNKKEKVITRTKDGKESTTEVVTQEIDSNAPISSQLTEEQVQSIIMENLSILGNMAKEANAEDEYNALMVKLGLPVLED